MAGRHGRINSKRMVQIDNMREVVARTKFISAKPLLADVSKTINLKGIGWLIAGGEFDSGPEYV